MDKNNVERSVAELPELIKKIDKISTLLGDSSIMSKYSNRSRISDDTLGSMVNAYNDTLRSMMNAYINGDENLDQFPDSVEKKTVLQDINTLKSRMSRKKLSIEEISDIKVKLNSSDEVEKTRIILDIVDNYDTSSEELKEIFRPHKELLLRIMKLNKN